ncbi:hypothetical protein MOUN0_M08592 [Monosporozyma unispora]
MSEQLQHDVNKLRKEVEDLRESVNGLGEILNESQNKKSKFQQETIRKLGNLWSKYEPAFNSRPFTLFVHAYLFFASNSLANNFPIKALKIAVAIFCGFLTGRNPHGSELPWWAFQIMFAAYTLDDVTELVKVYYDSGRFIFSKCLRLCLQFLIHFILNTLSIAIYWSLKMEIRKYESYSNKELQKPGKTLPHILLQSIVAALLVLAFLISFSALFYYILRKYLS